MTDTASIKTLPFEKALAELEDIVRRLERGDVPLEDSIAIYERGEALKKHCEQLLKKAEARIEKITIGPDGAASGNGSARRCGITRLGRDDVRVAFDPGPPATLSPLGRPPA